MPSLVNSHINVLELETVHVAAELWGKAWSGKHIMVRSDNSATVSAINKGTSRGPELMLIVQKLFWLSVRYGFKLTASYIPGPLNVLSDRISRLHTPCAAMEAKSFLNCVHDEVECFGHMSYQAFSHLQSWWEETYPLF